MMKKRKAMQISELIQQLTEARRKHGDVPIRIWQEEMDYAFPFVVDVIPERIGKKYPQLSGSIVLNPIDALERDASSEIEPPGQ
jgi:hypothetical protein